MSGKWRQWTGADDAEKTAIGAAGVMSDAAREAAEIGVDGVYRGAGHERDGVISGGNTEAGYIDQARHYLQGREQLPMGIKDTALRGLAGFYGVPGMGVDQQQIVDKVLQSPVYQSMLGQKQWGEDAIMRNASATGGLRSGNTNRALYDYNQRFANEAFQDTLGMALTGLGGLASMPTSERQIADYMVDEGRVRGDTSRQVGQIGGGADRQAAQLWHEAVINAANAHAGGMLGKGQIRADSGQNFLDTLIGIGQGAATYYSDIRLKANLEYIGHRDGYPWYIWTWNDEAAKMGLEGPGIGVLAHEVYERNPEAVGEKDGYITVRYDKIPEFEHRRAA